MVQLGDIVVIITSGILVSCLLSNNLLVEVQLNKDCDLTDLLTDIVDIMLEL